MSTRNLLAMAPLLAFQLFLFLPSPLRNLTIPFRVGINGLRELGKELFGLGVGEVSGMP